MEIWDVEYWEWDVRPLKRIGLGGNVKEESDQTASSVNTDYARLSLLASDMLTNQKMEFYTWQICSQTYPTLLVYPSQQYTS